MNDKPAEGSNSFLAEEPQPKRRRRISAGVVVLVVVALCVGLLAGMVVTGWRSQIVSTEQANESTLPVAIQSYDGRWTVSASLEISPPVKLSANGDGFVTTVSLHQGDAIESGTVVMWVNAEPVVALATSIPLYRDLVIGDRGTDVAALQEMLIARGYLSGSADGLFWYTTYEAVRALKRDLGFPDTMDGSFHLRWFVWLPIASFRVDHLTVIAGDRISSGTVFASQDGSLSKITFEPGADFTADDRPLEADLFGEIVPVEDLAVTSADALALLTATKDYRYFSSVDGGFDDWKVKLRYQEPITVLRVPAAALFAVNSSSACLSSSGETHRVTIVSSSLGGTLVDAADWTPTTVDVGQSVEGLTCPN